MELLLLKFIYSLSFTDCIMNYAVVHHNILRFNNPRVSAAGTYTCQLILLPHIKAYYTLRIIGKLIHVASYRYIYLGLFLAVL